MENLETVAKNIIKLQTNGSEVETLSNGFMRQNYWLAFGKHKGKQPWAVVAADPGYYIWAWENVRNKMPERLQNFIREMAPHIKAAAEAKTKKDDNLFS